MITFQPDLAFHKRLSSYMDKVDHVYIVDNSEPATKFDRSLLNNQKITILSSGTNKGIAERLNQVADIAIKAGYQWLLTMDQDSYFMEEQISAYLEYAIEDPQRDQVAMFGVETTRRPELITNLQEPVDRLITSGSLLNLSLFKQVGPFDENLFIDEVDHEYCYRAILKSFKIILFTHIFLEHQLGQDKQVKTLKGGIKTASFHSPLRLYYMVRNFLYVRHQYKNDFQADLKLRGTGLMHRLKNNLLYGHSKWETLKMVLLAVRDYSKHQMGKKR